MFNLTIDNLLELAAEKAGKRNTGNGGLALILLIAREAYRSGQAGSLAKHVATWQAQRSTAEYGQAFQLRKAA